jgi:hypothetical protein
LRRVGGQLINKCSGFPEEAPEDSQWEVSTVSVSAMQPGFEKILSKQSDVFASVDIPQGR